MRFLLAFLLLLPLRAAEDGFVSLFDGKTLNGWFIVNKMGPGFLVKTASSSAPTKAARNS